VYSGTGQFAALPLWNGSVLLLTLSILVLSLRFALMTASVAPGLAGLPRPLRALLAFGMTDETYALTIVRQRGRVEPGYLFGGWLAMYLGWLGGTVVGVLVGARVPEAWLGPLESLFPVVFLALAVLCCVSRATTVVMLLGAGLAAVGATLVPGGWHVVAAGLLASLAGPLLESRLGGASPTEPRDEPTP
jgi:predicted branched-subunit amino acid permease